MKEKIRKIIENNPVAFATTSNNRPHVIGVAHCKVLGKNTILITDNFMRLTVKNKKKQQCCFGCLE